jgi:membrane protease YdiL (CAAX protease family)
VLVGVVLWIVVAVRRREGGLRPAFRPPAEYGAWYLQAFALYVGLFFLLQIVPALLEPEVAAPIAFVGLVLASALGVLWPIIRGVPFGTARVDLGIHRGKGLLREVASGVVGYVAILPIFAGGFLVTLLLMILWEAINPSGEPSGPMSHPIVPMMAEGGTAVRIAVLLLASGFAPLFEEVLFRGALFADLRRFLGPIGAGLLIGVLFAAIHPQGVFTIPALGALAFGFALLREWRGSLIAPIVAHALHNGALVAIMWLLLGS